MSEVRQNRFITFLRYFLGPADSSPMETEPVDTSGHGKRICPECGHPFDEHVIERGAHSRIYCPPS